MFKILSLKCQELPVDVALGVLRNCKTTRMFRSGFTEVGHYDSRWEFHYSWMRPLHKTETDKSTIFSLGQTKCQAMKTSSSERTGGHPVLPLGKKMNYFRNVLVHYWSSAPSSHTPLHGQSTRHWQLVSSTPVTPDIHHRTSWCERLCKESEFISFSATLDWRY